LKLIILSKVEKRLLNEQCKWKTKIDTGYINNVVYVNVAQDISITMRKIPY